MISNALEKSAKAAKVTSPLLVTYLMLSRSLKRIVNVEWFFLYIIFFRYIRSFDVV